MGTKLAAAAAKKTTAPAEEKKTTALATVKKNEVAVGAIDFSADSGMGMEGADKDSFAIPFLAVLQGLSPALKTVEGAKPGLIMNTVTNALYSALAVVPVAFQRRYNRWLPRSEGGGFRGTLTVAEVEKLIASGAAKNVQVTGQDGKPFDQLMYDGTALKDTRNHFVLVVDEDGAWSPALISLASTQIKRSKKWMALMQSLLQTAPNGKKFIPPSFANVYTVSTEEDSNNKGTWEAFTFDFAQPVDDPELYQAAKDFHAQVSAGEVVVAPPIDEEAEVGGASTGGKF